MIGTKNQDKRVKPLQEQNNEQKRKYDNLAQMVSSVRDKLGMSQSGLAKKCNLTVEQIESIESGQELFLPPTIRQKLAKGLKLNLLEIKMYEKPPLEDFKLDLITEDYMKQAILEGNTDNLRCPSCGSKLQTRIARMYDLEDNLVLTPKAHCTKCPFQII